MTFNSLIFITIISARYAYIIYHTFNYNVTIMIIYYYNIFSLFWFHYNLKVGAAKQAPLWALTKMWLKQDQGAKGRWTLLYQRLALTSSTPTSPLVSSLVSSLGHSISAFFRTLSFMTLSHWESQPTSNIKWVGEPD